MPIAVSPLLTLLLMGVARPTTTTVPLPHGGLNRNYILVQPSGQASLEGRPLVVFLHGFTSSAQAFERYLGISAKAEQHGFVAAIPNGSGTSSGWNAGFIDLTGRKSDDVGFLSKVIDDVESKTKIDKDRIFLFGHSNGAMMAHRFAAATDGRIRAFSAVAGTIGIGKGAARQELAAPKQPVSALILHSPTDKVVAYDEQSEALLKGDGALTAAKFWVKHNQCSSVSVDVKTDQFSERRFILGNRSTEVVMVSYPVGGHDVPGSTNPGSAKFNAIDLSWKFFLERSPKKP